MTKKSNDNGWNVLRTCMLLLKNGWTRTISLINMTHPSLEEALDEVNLRATNLWEILDNKMSNECHRHGMMEIMFSPMDIHEESTLELKKEDYIDEHGSYFMNISSNPCSLMLSSFSSYKGVSS